MFIIRLKSASGVSVRPFSGLKNEDLIITINKLSVFALIIISLITSLTFTYLASTLSNSQQKSLLHRHIYSVGK